MNLSYSTVEVGLTKTDKQKMKALYKELKNLLWDGKPEQLISKVAELSKGQKLILDKLTYFYKHITRMNYDYLRQKNLPCGSGIVESAIRRVINLRFKSPSIFWKNENVEKLIFLRAVFLAGRWNIIIDNLIQVNQKFVRLNFKLASL